VQKPGPGPDNISTTLYAAASCAAMAQLVLLYDNQNHFLPISKVVLFFIEV